MGYKIKQILCYNGRGEYNNNTLRYVLGARDTTYESCPPYEHHNNGVSQRMIRTIAKMAQAIMIDSKVPVLFWGEAVNTTVYLHQRSLSEGLKRTNARNGYQAQYPMPHKMLHRVGKPTPNAHSNDI